MAFVKVPKDLTKVKNKIMFNLTKRQLICFALAGGTGIPFYLFMKNFIGTDIAAILMITLMLPFFLFALYEKDGMHLETVLRNYIRVKYIYPSKRPYMTENQYRQLQDEIQAKEGKVLEKQTNKKQKHKKHTAKRSKPKRKHI